MRRAGFCRVRALLLELAMPMVLVLAVGAMSASAESPASSGLRAAYPDLAILICDPEEVYNSWDQSIQQTSVGKLFYAEYPDHYDFLVVYPLIPHDTNYSFHTVAQNSVSGIGLDQKDVSSWFGSGGRLLGMSICTSAASPSLVLHELGHQWTAYARYCASGGVISHDLYALWSYAPYHWMWLTDGFGVMGGSAWHDNGDGTFTMLDAPAERPYLPVSLYMMGLLVPAEVPPIGRLVLDEPYGYYQPGDTVNAHEELVQIDDIICAEGPREPPVGESQIQFRAAFVVLLFEDTPTTGLDAIERVRAQVPDAFSRATGGRATIDTTLYGRERLSLPHLRGRAADR